MFFVICYYICCRTVKDRLNRSGCELYEYEKLNPNGEELEEDNGQKIEDTVWDVNNNNEKISKFVNQYQTDIKSLMT